MLLEGFILTLLALLLPFGILSLDYRGRIDRVSKCVDCYYDPFRHLQIIFLFFLCDLCLGTLLMSTFLRKKNCISPVYFLKNVFIYIFLKYKSRLKTILFLLVIHIYVVVLYQQCFAQIAFIIFEVFAFSVLENTYWLVGGGWVVRWSWINFPAIWMTVGQKPNALAVGASGGCLDIFTLIFSLLFLPLLGRWPDTD